MDSMDSMDGEWTLFLDAPEVWWGPALVAGSHFLLGVAREVAMITEYVRRSTFSQLWNVDLD